MAAAALRRVPTALATAFLLCALRWPGAWATPCTDAGGEDTLNLSGGDLPGSPHPLEAPDPAICAAMCNRTEECEVWTYHKGDCSGHGESKQLRCYLKSTNVKPAANPCTCSGKKHPGKLPPAPPPPPPPAPAGGAGALGDCPLPAPPKSPPRGAKNVLYLLVDDLRPSLSPYGQTQVHTPNIQKFADGAMVFLRAYCQEAVCSPSRNSFLSGRRPDITRAWNFINHFRQADTGLELPNTVILGSPDHALTISQGKGGAGECGSQCTTHAACQSWSYTPGKSKCELFSMPLDNTTQTESKGTTSGRTANLSVASSWNWTACPELFRKNGYLTLGTGKIYHTEEGGSTSCWNGMGMPPNQDPISWSPNGSMFCVNCVAPMVGCADPVLNLQHGCADNATLEGDLHKPVQPSPGAHANLVHDSDGEPEGDGGQKWPLCDKTIGDDALSKLDLAAATLKASQKPFYLATGFRKPHTPWRFPAPYLNYYKAVGLIDVAKHPVLDRSVPPIAISSFDFQNPYTPMDKSDSQSNRLAYYAAVSWMDFNVGRVLDRLDSHALTSNTIVAFHADHGWNLGEHGQWQKFTNWETGVRVPLIIRDPFRPQSHGKRSSALVELVDLMPTLAALSGVPLPVGEKLSGLSLAPLLDDPTLPMLPGKDWALSQYPRCPADLNNSANYYENNKCEFVERSVIPFMGYSLRTDTYRYTEWCRWNGSVLRPDFDQLVGAELYAHPAGNTTGCDGSMNSCFDEFENVNLVHSEPTVAAELSAKLHAIVSAQYEE